MRIHVLVEGRVQGVGFRQHVLDRARSLGVGGWVRNLDDGRVEAVFAGPPEAVESMVAWCRRGPGGARVDEVEATAEPWHDEPELFRIAFAQRPPG